MACETELVVCCFVGDPGCNPNCSHAMPHQEHKPHQFKDDGGKPCTLWEWCEDINGSVKCHTPNI